MMFKLSVALCMGVVLLTACQQSPPSVQARAAPQTQVAPPAPAAKPYMPVLPVTTVTGKAPALEELPVQHLDPIVVTPEGWHTEPVSEQN